MECLLDIKTTQLSALRVFDTGNKTWGLSIYGIVSEHRDNGKTNYRFGTMAQVISILKTYQYSVIREYCKEYNTFINKNVFELK